MGQVWREDQPHLKVKVILRLKPFPLKVTSTGSSSFLNQGYLYSKLRQLLLQGKSNIYVCIRKSVSVIPW